MHKDHAEYIRFSRNARMSKVINSLVGIVEGIAIDSEINRKELAFLHDWVAEQREVANKHPFNELVPVVEIAVHDGVLTQSEKQDILWLCERLTSGDIFAGSMQRLHTILAGIAADALISDLELAGLSKWLDEHDHLKTCWPYDEIETLVTDVLRDRKIERNEHEQLLHFFSEFGQGGAAKTLTQVANFGSPLVTGLCAVTPDVSFEGSRFCFTGASEKFSRKEFKSIVVARGGVTTDAVGPTLDYLVVGAAGNPCWMYACYGRKVEAAMALRREGHRLVLVHEYDFNDAIA